MAWAIYLDESGQTANTTPYAVFGGFGIEKAKEPLFIEAFKALYKDCFGIAYEESFDLKGKNLFEKKKIKWANSLPLFSDEERQNYAAQFRTIGPNAGYIHEGRAAFGQAGLKFADELITLLEKFDCRLFSAISKFGVDVPLRDKRLIIKLKKHFLTPSDENYVTRLINELEILVYEDIFKFIKKVSDFNCSIYVDDTEDGKSTGLREAFFNTSRRAFYYGYEHTFSYDRNKGFNRVIKRVVKNLSDDYLPQSSFNICKSDESLMIQIADIVCYILNFGFKSLKNDEKTDVKIVYLKDIFKKHYVKKISFFLQTNITKELENRFYKDESILREFKKRKP